MLCQIEWIVLSRLIHKLTSVGANSIDVVCCIDIPCRRRHATHPPRFSIAVPRLRQAQAPKRAELDRRETRIAQWRRGWDYSARSASPLRGRPPGVDASEDAMRVATTTE